MNKAIQDRLEELELPLEEATPFLGESYRYYYTYIVVPNNEKSSMYIKVYFGQHTTDKLDDGYIASGKKIKRYLKKYPGQFYRKIIAFYNNADELNKAEKDLIDGHLNKDYCLNLKEGGDCGLFSEESKKKMSENSWMRGRTGELNPMHGRTGELHPMHGRTHTDETKQKIREMCTGKHPSEESRKKMSDAKKGKYTGDKNPMYGKNAEDYMTPEAIKEKRRKQRENSGMRGKPSVNRKPIVIDKVTYESIAAAAETHEVSSAAIHKWLKEGKAKYI